jgi:hypothetical protein
MAGDTLRLTTEPKTLRMTNVHLFCADSIVTKFEDTATIIRAHGKIRLETYHKRKAFQEKELEALLIRLNAKARFVLEVIEGKIVLLGRKADLEAQLVEREFPDLNGLDYLIQMPISSLLVKARRTRRGRCGQGRRTGGIGEHHRCGDVDARTGRTSYRALEGRGLSLCAILTYSR